MKPDLGLEPEVVDFVTISEYETYVEQLIKLKQSYQTKVLKGSRKFPRRLRVILLSRKPDNGTD